MPDSLSRTVPIWCAVVNRVVLRLRRERTRTERRIRRRRIGLGLRLGEEEEEEGEKGPQVQRHEVQGHEVQGQSAEQVHFEGSSSFSASADGASARLAGLSLAPRRSSSLVSPPPRDDDDDDDDVRQEEKVGKKKEEDKDGVVDDGEKEGEDRDEMDDDDDDVQDEDEWDTDLHVPWSVSSTERLAMFNQLDAHVERVLSSGAIVDPAKLLAVMDRPLIPCWITRRRDDMDGRHFKGREERFAKIICVSCSDQQHFFGDKDKDKDEGNTNSKAEDVATLVGSGSSSTHEPAVSLSSGRRSSDSPSSPSSFRYCAGAADDQEAWGQGLTPSLFWNKMRHLPLRDMTDEDVDEAIRKVVREEEEGEEEEERGGRGGQEGGRGGGGEKERDKKKKAGRRKGQGQGQDDCETNDDDDKAEREREDEDAIAFTYDDDDHADCSSSSSSSSSSGADSFSSSSDASDAKVLRPPSACIWVGGRRSGRPPYCFERFDYVLNVTCDSYALLSSSSSSSSSDPSSSSSPCLALPSGKYYMQLPVPEGKRNKSDLERWLPAGLLFCLTALKQRGKRLLIHCAQGRDRSIAVAIVAAKLFCEDEGRGRDTTRCTVRDNVVGRMDVGRLETICCVDENDDSGGGEKVGGSVTADEPSLPPSSMYYLNSGLKASVVEKLLEHKVGRRKFLDWYRSETGMQPEDRLATKESLRVVLHKIAHCRIKADPTRTTLQKVNRFLMSEDGETGREDDGRHDWK